MSRNSHYQQGLSDGKNGRNHKDFTSNPISIMINLIRRLFGSEQSKEEAEAYNEGFKAGQIQRLNENLEKERKQNSSSWLW